MKAIDNVNIVNQLEREFKVEDWKINGVEIWPFIRAEIGLSCYHLILNEGKHVSLNLPEKRIGHFKRAISVLKKYYNGCRLNRQLSKTNKYKGCSNLISSSMNYLRVIEGLGFDKFADSLSLKLDREKGEKSVVFIHNANYVKHKNLTEIYNIEEKVLIEDLVYYHILKSRFKRKIKNAAVHLDRFDEFLNHDLIKKIRLKNKINRVTLVQFALQVQSLGNTFSKFISNNGISKVYGFNYYSLKNYALVYAGNNLEIPTYDVQHGVAGDVHMSYGMGRFIPENGFNIMPKNYWTWDKASSNTIDNWNCKSIIAEVLGNPWIELWKGKYYQGIFKIDAPEDFQSLLERKKIALISLQDLKDSIPSEIIQLMKEDNEIFFLLRLHPSQENGEELVQQLVNQGLTNNFNIEQATILPLHYLLPYVSLHLTRFSSVAIEALEYGITTVFLDQNGLDFFSTNLPGEFVKDGIGKDLKKIVAENIY
jgi:hypothetical protein